jgi:aminoglycoside phosphotransferase family enzyme/predicted kinase
VAIPDEQREVADFLQAVTGSAPNETHISAVFVGGNEVLKLKKAVRLSFLDFTTLATRRAMCRRELELNRLAAPGIYRGIQAVARTAQGALALADQDTPGALDYVVRMARVPAGDFLDDIVTSGGPTPRLLDALGDAVAALHARLPPVPDWDVVAGMEGIIAGNVAAAHAAGLPKNDVHSWNTSVLAALGQIAPLLRARAAAGFVRRAHGDLHLGNMCLWHGEPVAFDMLEFDESLATIDLGYDLAFLIMDLEFRAGRAAANRVLNRYLARTGDTDLLADLPCFMSVRAMVRAHVQASRDKPDDAARYLALAQTLLHPAPPLVLAVGGVQGTGKSTLARGLAPTMGRSPGAFLLRSDELRKRQFGAKPEEKLPATAYDPGANARVNQALLQEAATALRAGQAVLADSTFLNEKLRQGIEAAARAANAPFLGLWLEADPETLLRRVAARANDASDAGPDIVRQALDVDPGHITWHRIQAEDAAAALAAAKTLLAGLPVEPRSAPAPATPQIRAGQGSSGHGHDDAR